MVYLWKQLTLSNDILKYFVKFNFFRFIKEDAILSNKSEKKNKDEYNTAKFNIDINSSFAEDLNQSPLKSNDLTEKIESHVFNFNKRPSINESNWSNNDSNQIIVYDNPQRKWIYLSNDDEED